MKNFWLTTLSIVTAAAIGANCAMLFQFGERLARVETKIEMLARQQTTTTAKNP